jgi:uncharacterized damage-inducible protein DinB
MRSSILSRRKFFKVASASAAGLAVSATGVSASNRLETSTHLSEGAVFRKTFGDLWNRIATYSIATANTMPTEHYDFKPVPEVRSFKEQMLHIANSDFWIENYLATGKGTGSDYESASITKAGVVTLLEDSFKNMSGIIAALTDEELKTNVETFAGVLNRMEVLYFMRDHITHHRAQTVVYLRLNGITPPEYVGS